MQSQTLLAVAAVVATALGSFGVIGQILVARRQAHLQEATAYRDQTVAWRGLDNDWLRLLLAGLGPADAQRRGVNSDLVADYAASLAEYRNARVAFQDLLSDVDSYDASGQWDALLEAASKRQQEAWQALSSFEVSVRRVLVYLAQVADLILRRRLSVHAVYDALGHDLMRNHDALVAVTKFAYDYDGCVATWNEEGYWWRDLSIDEISPRVGWASALGDSPGTLDRIDVLFDVIAIRAFEIGDGYNGVTGDFLVDKIGDRQSLAVRWKVVAKVSRVQAAKFTWEASRVFRKQTVYPSTIDHVRYSKRKASAIWEATLMVGRRLIGPVLPLVDVPRVAWASRRIRPSGRWNQPVERSSTPSEAADPHGSSTA